MNKFFLLIITTLVLVIGVGSLFWVRHNSNINQTSRHKKGRVNSNVTKNKNLIVYYSRTGNTKAVAKLIQERVGGDLIQIETEEPRPKEYNSEVAQNSEEQSSNALPKLKTKIHNFEDYTHVFIGTPTWNMALPQPVESFIKSYSFSGKTVVPFNTNAGYGEGSTFSQIKSGVKGAKVLDGFSVEGGKESNGILLSIKGNRRTEVAKDIDRWLNQLNIKE